MAFVANGKYFKISSGLADSVGLVVIDSHRVPSNFYKLDSQHIALREHRTTQPRAIQMDQGIFSKIITRASVKSHQRAWINGSLTVRELILHFHVS